MDSTDADTDSGKSSPVEKTVETTIQKKLSKISEICKKILVVEFCYSQTMFFFCLFVCFAFVVHSNFVYDSEANYLMKLYFTLHKKSNFPLRISSVNVTADLVT